MHHRRGTNEDDEPLRGDVRLDLVVLELAAEKVFHGLPCRFLDFKVFIEAKVGQTEACGPHQAPGAPWCLAGRSFIFLFLPKASRVSYC